MQGVPLHPILVHIPIGVTVVFPLVALGLTLALRRGVLTQRAWIVAVALQAIVVIAGVAALKTGEKEEDRVEDIVGERRVEAHAERAEAFLWAAGTTFVLSGAVLVLGPGPAVAVAGITTFASVVTLGLAYRVGHSGGELVYKYGAASAYAEPAIGGSQDGAPGQRGEGRDRDGDDD